MCMLLVTFNFSGVFLYATGESTEYRDRYVNVFLELSLKKYVGICECCSSGPPASEFFELEPHFWYIIFRLLLRVRK